MQNDSLEVLQLSSDPYLVPVLPNGPAAPVHHSLSRHTTASRVIRGSFKNCFLKSIKPHDLESILSTSYFYSFTLEGLYIIF